MSLVLSKILPIFLYPLGLTSVLLVVTLFSLWRRRGRFTRTSVISVCLATLVLFSSSSQVVSDILVRSLEQQNIPTGEVPLAGAIVVLGGGTKPMMPPRPWIEVAEAGDRILYGSKLWLERKAPILIVSGGRAEWLGEGGQPESLDMAAIAEVMGVPAQDIVQDSTSLNTYENAVNVRQILQQRGIKKVLLVTSALHMPRSLAIFQKQNIDAIAAPTDFISVNSSNDKGIGGALVNLLPSAYALKNTTDAIKEYIGILFYKLRGWA
jgi:uncharacterized SAM-binding protein YcdF (DUF218 family)